MRSFLVGMVSAASLLLLAAGCGEVKLTGEVDARPIDAFEGTAMLAIDRDMADFGMVVVGQTSPPQTFTISNPGTAPTGALAVTVTGIGFASSNDRCTGMTLAPNASCQISVTLTPMRDGSPAGSLQVTGDPGGMVDADLSGTALTPGALEVNPMAKDYLVVPLGSTSATETFTFTNTGGVATGNVMVALGGANPAQFEITTDGCTGSPLAAGRTCSVDVRFAPAGSAAPGAKAATLTGMANPGGAALANLSGTAQTPANVVLGGSGAFGDQPTGTMMTKTITVTNTGQQTSGALMIARMGNAAFSILGGMAGDCVSGTTTLASGAMCNIRVQFAPTASGAVMGTITVNSAPGGGGNVLLSGNGQRPATLSANINAAPFGVLEVGQLSMGSFVWIITNNGEVPSSPAMYSSTTMEIDTSGGNTCNAVIMPNTTCVVTMKFRPSMGGARMGTATVSITGSMVTLNATATGAFRVTVTRNGNSGTITSNPAGLNCAPPANTCSALFAPGDVVLQARTTNGSTFFFSGWTGASAGACLGSPNQDCTLPVNAAEAITGTFSSITSNLVFVTSSTYPTTMGGTAPYDAACNAAATAAGINNAGGNNFIAMISDANSNGWSRLGTVAAASGWVRMDGRVFATSRATINAGTILNPVRYSETGADVVNAVVMTGTNEDGTVSGGTCSNWSSAAVGVSAIVGDSFGGPSYWIGGSGVSCSNGPYRLLCMMRQFTTGVAAPPAFAGKRVWLSNSAYAPAGTNNPDTLCNTDRPMGAISGRALISRTTAAASTLLGAAQMYVRPDGQEVGTGTEISMMQHRGGIWQSGNGSYYNGFAWSGANAITALGAANTTCGDWTDVTQFGIRALPGMTRRMWNMGFAPLACSNIPATGPRIYCYEP